MSKAVVKSNVEAVLRKLNSIQMEHEGGYKTKSFNHLVDIRATVYGYEISIQNDHLKIGGEDDDDSNQSTLFYELDKFFEKEMKAYKDIVVDNISNQYKGYWGVVISLKSDKPKLKQVQKLCENKSRLETSLSVFNNLVFSKLQNGSSKTKTCVSCKSKITILSLKNVCCPACSKELYSITEANKANKIKEKISAIDAEIKSLLT